MIEEQLTEDTRNWLDNVGVDVVEVVDRSWPDSDTRVSQLNLGNGHRVFMKQFTCSDKFNQEVNAYETWLSDVAALAPKMLFVDKAGLRFVMSDVGDCCCPWGKLSPDQQEALQFQAGRFLRTLHDIEFVDQGKLPIGNAILLRAQATQRRIVELQADSSRDTLEEAHVDEMTRVVANIEEIVPLLNRFKRVPCHRDFWKRNWIWSLNELQAVEEVSLHVIDFEHARPDLFVFDLMKNWSDCWLGNPQLEEAFWRGYGRLLDDDERLALHRCGALHAMQTILWAGEHQQTEFLTQGEALLAVARRA